MALFEGMPGRGLVSALLPNKMIKVKFVDFGNFELFNAADLWKLSVEYLNFPQLVCDIISGSNPSSTVSCYFHNTPPEAD